MKSILPLDRWPRTTAEAKAIQTDIRQSIVTRNELRKVRFVAGIDIAYDKSKDEGWAGVVMFRYPSLTLAGQHHARGKVTFPYVPGFLSFREGPIILKAFEGLSRRPDLLLLDGQGIAHPRRCGLASHLGVLLNIPSVGVAKSKLFGKFEEPGEEVGSLTDLLDGDGNVIGAVVRTRRAVKPLFVSIGHKVDLPTAIHYVLSCCRGYRLPEPTRQAHLLVQRLRNA